MRISANTLKQRPEIVLEHAGDSIEFSASVFQRKAFEQGFDVFDPINRYWDRMHPQMLDEIWVIYKEVYRGFDQILSSAELHMHLKKQIRELIRLHPLQHIETWVSMDPSFSIPEQVKDVFIADEENKNTPDKTYVRKDYIQLVALSIFTRCLMPIFGEYIDSTRRETGVSRKEFEALQLLTETELMESETITKLRSYIDEITKEKHRSPERILDGTSSEDMGFLLMALVIIRKLCVSDVRGTEPKSNIVSRVYNFLYQKVFNPTKTDVPVKEKSFTDTSDSSDQTKRSILESYRKRTEFSLGERAGLEYGYENIIGTALRLAPDIDRHQLERSIMSAQALKNERLGDAQLIMMAWVFKRIHTPRAIYYIPKDLLIMNLGVLEAVLWHWGFHYLAVLSTSHLVLGQDDMHISPVDNRGQIPNDLQKQIMSHYPYTWSTLRKTTMVSSTEQNPVIHAIDLVVDDLINNAWRSTAHEDKIQQVFGEFRRKMVIFPNIKSELAKLLIHIAEQK